MLGRRSVLPRAAPLAALLLAAMAACGERTSANASDLAPPLRPIERGDTMPAFRAPLLDGDTVSLSAFRGRVLVLHVWAAGCASCITHLPWLRDAYRELGEYGLEVVSLSLDAAGDDQAVRDVIRRYDVRHVVLRDPGRTFWPATGMRGYPPVLVIDRSGVILHLQQLPVADGATPAWLPVVRGQFAHTASR